MEVKRKKMVATSGYQIVVLCFPLCDTYQAFMHFLLMLILFGSHDNTLLIYTSDRTFMVTKCQKSFKCSIGRYCKSKAETVLSHEQIQKESHAG